MSASYSSFDDIPRGKYGLIMADPNWSFKTRSDKGLSKSAQNHYACSSIEDICAVPVGDFAAEDCLLWLWATNPMLPEALQAMSAWGFTYKTAGTWLKMSSTWTPNKVNPKVSFGTGYILRSSNEPYIIATRGNPKAVSNSVRSGFLAAVRGHSRKPESAYDHAKALIPNEPALDLYSRQQRLGWDCAGDEVTKFEAQK